MARGTAVTLGGVTYRTLGEAKAYVSAVLNAYAPGAVVRDPAHIAMLHDLLRRSDEYELKAGSGVKGFCVLQNAEYPSKGFHVVRTDGTTMDFSYIYCLRREPKRNVRQEALAAFRKCVEPQTRQVWEAQVAEYAVDGMIVCGLTGDTVPVSETHVDHVDPPFLAIVEDFLAEHAMGFEDVPLSDPAERRAVPVLSDTDWCEAFADFHQRKAWMVVCHKTANLRKGKRT